MDVCVILDTNGYISTSDEAINRARSMERRSRVRPMASFLSLTELLAHAADPNSADHRHSRAAIRRLWMHCAEYSVAGGHLPIAADPQGVVAKTLFRKRPPGRDILARAFESLARRIALADSSDRLEDIQGDLDAVKRFRDHVEMQFVGALENIKRQFGLDPDAPSDFAPAQRPPVRPYIESGPTKLLCACALVMNVARELQIELNDAHVARLAAILAPTIPTSLAIFELALRKVLLDGAVARKRMNYVWDMYFAIFAAESMRVEQLPALLVTDDRDLHAVGDETGASDRILTWIGYERWLAARAL